VKALVTRYFDELLNRMDLSVADEILAEEGFVFRAGSVEVRGREEFKRYAPTLRNYFGELEFVIEEQLVEGDRGAAHVTMRGVHRGELMGVPPTGKPFAMPGVDLFWFEDGRIKEILVIANVLELLRQIGASPPGLPR
jgi:steroid delta-isomerase-like uncharacterized protein